jgi:hypothetical protein
MDISMTKRVYRNMAAIIMRMKTTLESRESKGAQDMSMMGAYSSDMIKMVRTAKPMGSMKPPDTGMSWKKRRRWVMTLQAVGR